MIARVFRMQQLAAFVLLALMSSFAPASSVAAAIPITAARSLPLGSTVTLKGTVTVPSSAFESGTFDQGFAIQDTTGGIYVSVPVDLNLAIGAQVAVTGQLTDSSGLLILTASADDVKRKGRRHPVAPVPIATAGVSEATEGRLVAISGVVTQPVGDDLPYGYRLFVNDGSGEAQVFIYASTGIDVSSLQPGQTVHVIGLSAQFADHYEINPRLPGDISVL